jgi:hypothetical protein
MIRIGNPLQVLTCFATAHLISWEAFDSALSSILTIAAMYSGSKTVSQNFRHSTSGLQPRCDGALLLCAQNVGRI